MSDTPPGAPMTAADVRADAKRAQLMATRTATGHLAIIPQDFEQVWALAGMFATGNLGVPKDFRDNRSLCAIAIMWGMELGLSAVQSIQGMANINGRMGVWGDTLHAICRAHPDYVDLVEEILTDKSSGAVTGYTITAVRKGKRDVVRTFTMEMARAAGLTAKRDTPWQTFPERMCYWRAKSWALRDQFNDALRGVASAEELRDHASVEATVEPPPAPRQTPRERVAPPLQDGDVETVDTPASVAATDHQAQTAATVRAATPELDALAGTAAGVVGAAHKDEAPQAAAAGGAPSVDLFAGADTPVVPPRKPLTDGQVKMIAAYWNTIEGQGGHVTHQDLIDHLGDEIHGGNFKAGMDWLQAACARGAAQ